MEVKIVKNFFNDDDIQQVKQFCEEVQDQVDFTSKGRWSDHLTIGRGNVNVYDLHPSLDEEIHSIVYNRMVEEFSMEPGAILFHFWQPESFITWHDDYSHAGAATVYLNEQWDINNGGLFLYDEGNGIRGEVPKFNKCVFQKDSTPHCTTATHWKSPVRKSLQVFFK